MGFTLFEIQTPQKTKFIFVSVQTNLFKQMVYILAPGLKQNKMKVVLLPCQSAPRSAAEWKLEINILVLREATPSFSMSIER